MSEKEKTGRIDTNWASALEALMEGYSEFGKSQRNWFDGTLKKYKGQLEHFSDWLANESELAELNDLDFKGLDTYLSTYCKTHKSGSHPSMFSALRSFLHFGAYRRAFEHGGWDPHGSEMGLEQSPFYS
jgi:site-specific recombinase XerD